jgi:hypothetical protein
MSKKADGFVTFIAFTVFFFLTPVSALLTAKIYSIMWGLLLEPQFGPGPSYQSWYGIACLVSMLTMHLKKDDSSQGEGRSPIAVAIQDILGSYIGMGIALGIAAFVRFVVGWP